MHTDEYVSIGIHLEKVTIPLVKPQSSVINMMKGQQEDIVLKNLTGYYCLSYVVQLHKNEIL